ncbi:hypothetical protein [Microbacterium murale]|uniref:Uncharacterized protein n=1 Tax=Microbacterium murale TaxID=1081040 RepID=A0ABQ1S1A3_9MICO|nr:hypothetical protein [Microbacterium murale]GGD89062.1 hypothetical protein GCM10007269_34650 [Microbacterium murale]
MLFSSTTNSTLWDVWLYYENETHYLFYLANSRPDRPWDGIGLATSSDGVHFDDHGMIITKASDAEYLGAGHTWKVGDKYVFNFSESRNGTLEIFFAESEDLIHWNRIPAEQSVSRSNSEWYADTTEISQQRWDNIWANTDASGDGYFGYVTAVAKDGPVGLRGTCASVTSKDGIVFTTGAPVIEPGSWPDRLEIGGVTKVGDQYYMFAALAEVPLGLDWAKHHSQAVGGVYVMRSDTQEGPFELDTRQPPVLVSSLGHHTYFARFYPCGDELLVAHHSLESRGFIATVMPKMGTWMAPLKKAEIDEGILSLHWWAGNEAMLGRDLPRVTDLVEARLAQSLTPNADGSFTFEAPLYSHAMLPFRYDFEKGVCIEATLRGSAYDNRAFAAGVLLEGDESWNGTAIVLDSTGKFEMGHTNGYSFWDEEGLNTAPLRAEGSRFRVLVRGTFVEVYIDDALIQCFALDKIPHGRLGFVAAAGTVTVSDVRVRELSM